MTGEIATFERVRHVADTLRKRGVAPTASRVISMIGGGSKTTVLAHLRRLRNAEPEVEAVPANVLDLARDVLSDIYLAGRSAEASTVRAATERLSQIVSELDAQVEELSDQNARLEWSKAQLIKQLDQARLERKQLEQRLERAEADLTSARTSFQEERGRLDVEMRDILAEMKQTLKAPPSNGRGGSKRPVLKLPRSSGTGDQPGP